MNISLILMTSMAMTLQMCDKKTKAPEKSSQVQQVAQNEPPKTLKVEKKKKPKVKKFTGKRLHPEKQFCISYKHTGQMMSGTSEMCSRKHGQESYTIEKLTMGIGGFTQSQNKHTVIYKDKIYSSTIGSGTWVVATNPLYEGLTKGNPEDLSKQMMAAMGMTKTGETEIIAGTKCNTYNSAQMGGGCFTKNMVMLRQSIMGMEQIATKVSIGSAGDSANYAKPKNPKQAPDIGNIMEMMGKRQ